MDVSGSDILSNATQVVGWSTSALGTLINFIAGNPVILCLFFVALVSFSVGLLYRIWKTV